MLNATELATDSPLIATSLAYLRVDRRGRITDWNPAAERLFGWTRDEVLGQAMADTIVPGHLRSAHTAGFSRRLVAEEGRSWPGTRVEVPARHRDGTELRVSMSIDGVDDGFVAFIADRTDRHHAQQELQRSTTLVNAILEHTSAMISAKDLDGRYLFVNGEYERRFQLLAADLVGRRDTELLPATVAAIGRAADDRVAETGAALTLSEELPFGDEVRQYVVTRFPLVNPDGSVYGVCSIAIDDTARRRTETALSESEQRFRATVNNAPGMLFQYRIAADGTTSFNFVSDACREIYGVEPDEVLADAGLLTDIVAEQDRAGFQASVANSVRTLAPWRWQGSVVRRDGSRRWLLGVGRPHRLADGTTVCDGMLVDRTDERAAELEIDELTRRLSVCRFTAVADRSGAPRLVSLDGDLEAGLLLLAVVEDGAWATALRGEPADLECTVGGRRLWIRLRPHETDGTRTIEGTCFDRR